MIHTQLDKVSSDKLATTQNDMLAKTVKCVSYETTIYDACQVFIKNIWIDTSKKN
jgi:uncharacterized membrane protein